MSKDGRHGKFDESRKGGKLKKLPGRPLSGRDIIRLDRHIKIAPKHPNMGKR
jgi:hypothetical protein